MDVKDIIRQAFARQGLDPEVGLKIARIESGFNPQAQNPQSSAGGLFQFIDSTARSYGLSDKFDPVANSEAAARFTNDNRNLLRSKLGREPTAGEIYLAHQQGAGGAIKLLSNPDASAADLLGAKAVTLNGGQPGMAARDFASLWANKLEGAKTTASPVKNGPAPPMQLASAPQTTPETPIAQPQAPEEPNIASVLGNAMTAFTNARAPQAASAPQQSFQQPQMMQKKPDLAKILATQSNPLLIGRPVA